VVLESCTILVGLYNFPVWEPWREGELLLSLDFCLNIKCSHVSQTVWKYCSSTKDLRGVEGKAHSKCPSRWWLSKFCGTIYLQLLIFHQCNYPITIFLFRPFAQFQCVNSESNHAGAHSIGFHVSSGIVVLCICHIRSWKLYTRFPDYWLECKLALYKQNCQR
jgi:hypothetical protein